MEHSKSTNGNLKNYEVDIKIKLAAFWTSVMFCYVYGDYFELYVPKKVEGLINGDNLLNSPMKLFAASLLLAIPALMILVSVVAKAKINKRLNLIFGAFYTAFMVLIAVTSISHWRIYYVFLAIVESFITSFIVWYAWKWPRQVGVIDNPDHN